MGQITLLLFQASYAGAEYIAEIETDHAGHLYVGDSYHGIHTDHSDHHDLESSSREGHCHGQIHTYLNPSYTYTNLPYLRANLAPEKHIHYYSLEPSPNLRPPVQAISFA